MQVALKAIAMGELDSEGRGKTEKVTGQSLGEHNFQKSGLHQGNFVSPKTCDNN